MTNRFPHAAPRKQNDELAGCLGAFLLILVLLPIVLLLSAVVTMLAWNLGVVALVAAAGGAVAKIGLGTAFFVNIAIGVVSRIFRSTPAKPAA